jgi:carbon storage regulator
MLVLIRRDGEEIKIGDQVTILVLSISRGKVKLGIAAPKEIPVHRAENAEKVSAEEAQLQTVEVSYDRLI